MPIHRRWHYPIVALAGAAGGFSFAPLHLGWLAFVCFVPLILIIEARGFRSMPTRLLYTFFFCFHGAANWWVMSWQKETDPYLMAAGAGLWLGHPFFLMPAFWVYSAMRRRQGVLPSLVALCLSWTAVEWLHSLTDLSYPWLALGYTQVYNGALAQIADIGGVWFVSLFILSINAILAHYALERGSVWKHFAWAVGIIFVVSFYGVWKQSEYSTNERTQTRRFDVGLVQPSIDPWDKWQGSVDAEIALHMRLQDSLNAVRHCALNVWSETAIPYALTLPQNAGLLHRLRQWVDSSHTSLLTGYADYVLYPKGTAPFNAQPYPRDPMLMMRIFNSAGILNPGASDIPTHHKSRLTPFGEYMPFSDDVPAIQSWLKWGVGISGWSRGEGANALPLVVDGDTAALIGPVICIESIYPNYVSDYIRQGANLLAVITNDAWYDGTFGPEQHYCIARLRAIETRTPVIRCGNSGISGYINAAGESVYQAPARTCRSIAVSVPWRGAQASEQSLYVRFGDWLPKLCTLFLMALIVWMRMRRPLTPASSAQS